MKYCHKTILVVPIVLFLSVAALVLQMSDVRRVKVDNDKTKSQVALNATGQRGESNTTINKTSISPMARTRLSEIDERLQRQVQHHHHHHHHDSIPTITPSSPPSEIFTATSHTSTSPSALPTTAIMESCTLLRYTFHYENTFNSTAFHDLWTPDCLRSLIDDHPTNMHLRLGLLRSMYEQQQQQQMTTNRHVVFYCQKGCGGIGDRLRSTLNTFYLALAMNATFTIDMELPVHWEDFFSPLNEEYFKTTNRGFFAKYNMTRDYNSHDFHLPSSLAQHQADIVISKARGDWDYKVKTRKEPMRNEELARLPNVAGADRYEDFEWFYNTNMEQELFGNVTKDVVVLSGMTFRMEAYKENKYAQQFWNDSRLKDLSRAERSYFFFRLFMPYPSVVLRDAMAPYVEQLQGQFVVGVHIRLGGEVKKPKGGWVDPKRHGPSCIQCIAEKARELCQSLACTIWLTSDSDYAVETMKSIFGQDTAIRVLVSTGLLTHIDRSSFQHQERIEQNTKSFLDWYILAQYCDTYVLSRSGFGEHASWFQMLNSTHFKPAFQYRSDNPCEFDDYRLIQHRLSAVEYRRT